MVVPVLDPTPLVIVEGFMSGAGAVVWGNFEQHSNYACQSNGERDRRTIFTSVGIVSSLHDRACELFYSLVGGTVDYGPKHAYEHKHGRYGRTHEKGLYPEWSVEHPLHFLGHSVGAPTITKLQYLLSTGFFGKKYHPDMILSINTVSSPFRGTQLVYWLGEDTRNAPNVRFFSAGSFLSKVVHIASYLSPVFPEILDLHAEARHLSYREASFKSFLKNLWKSSWSEGRDGTPYDVTFAAADEREAAGEGAVNRKTYYRSYSATLTSTPAGGSSKQSWISSALQKLSAWPFYLTSRAMKSFKFSQLRPTPAFLETVPSTKLESDDPLWLEDGVVGTSKSRRYCSDPLRENDGVVPLFSQWHPYDCGMTKCLHVSHSDSFLDAPSKKLRYESPPEAGVWHVHHLDNAHHVSLVPTWLGTDTQKAFWTDLGHWLRRLM